MAAQLLAQIGMALLMGAVMEVGKRISTEATEGVVLTQEAPIKTAMRAYIEGIASREYLIKTMTDRNMQQADQQVVLGLADKTIAENKEREELIKVKVAAQLLEGVNRQYDKISEEAEDVLLDGEEQLIKNDIDDVENDRAAAIDSLETDKKVLGIQLTPAVKKLAYDGIVQEIKVIDGKIAVIRSAAQSIINGLRIDAVQKKLDALAAKKSRYDKEYSAVKYLDVLKNIPAHSPLDVLLKSVQGVTIPSSLQPSKDVLPLPSFPSAIFSSVGVYKSINAAAPASPIGSPETIFLENDNAFAFMSLSNVEGPLTAIIRFDLAGEQEIFTHSIPAGKFDTYNVYYQKQKPYKFGKYDVAFGIEENASFEHVDIEIKGLTWQTIESFKVRDHPDIEELQIAAGMGTTKRNISWTWTLFGPRGVADSGTGAHDIGFEAQEARLLYDGVEVPGSRQIPGPGSAGWNFKVYDYQTPFYVEIQAR
ncbi:MAG: hypothetical protein QMD85_03050 [Candidatus Aenigmarchaeota archaeon]|nr:hypothetical protein [Candidatus Aenigmarchaeota archaeon]